MASDQLTRLTDIERIALTKLMDSIKNGDSQLPLTLVTICITALHRLVMTSD